MGLYQSEIGFPTLKHEVNYINGNLELAKAGYSFTTFDISETEQQFALPQPMPAKFVKEYFSIKEEMVKKFMILLNQRFQMGWIFLCRLERFIFF